MDGCEFVRKEKKGESSIFAKNIQITISVLSLSLWPLQDELTSTEWKARPDVIVVSSALLSSVTAIQRVFAFSGCKRSVAFWVDPEGFWVLVGQLALG